MAYKETTTSWSTLYPNRPKHVSVSEWSATLPTSSQNVSRPPFRPMPEDFRPPTNYSISSSNWSGAGSPYRIDITKRFRNGGKSYTIREMNQAPGLLLSELRKPAPISGLRSLGDLETRALNNLADGDFNVAVSAAEFNDSVKLIATRGKQLKQIFDAINNRDILTLKRLLRKPFDPKYFRKNFYDTVVEVQLGWKPILYDIVGAYDLIRSQFLKPEGYLVYGQSSHKSFNKVSHTGNYGLNLGITFDIKKSIVVNRNVQLIGKVKNPLIYKLASLGLTNPFNVAFEKVPYSFLLEYGIRIGAFLDSLDATLGLDFMGGYHSLRTTSVSTSSVASLARQRSQIFRATNTAVSGGTVSLITESYVRRKYDAFPDGSINIDRSPFSVNRAITTLGLLGSATESHIIRSH